MSKVLTTRSALSSFKTNRRLCFDWLKQYVLFLNPDGTMKKNAASSIDERIGKEYHLSSLKVATIRKQCGIVGNTKDKSCVLLRVIALAKNLKKGPVEKLDVSINEIFESILNHAVSNESNKPVPRAKSESVPQMETLNIASKETNLSLEEVQGILNSPESIQNAFKKILGSLRN